MARFFLTSAFLFFVQTNSAYSQELAEMVLVPQQATAEQIPEYPSKTAATYDLEWQNKLVKIEVNFVQNRVWSFEDLDQFNTSSIGPD